MKSSSSFSIIDRMRQLKRRAQEKLFDAYCIGSYSQDGEDMILRRLFEGKTDGFYVDVSAHHPKRFSNTYHFYKLGWHGINIDAMPGSMREFSRQRPRDMNVEAAIADTQRELVYFMFNEPALNSFDKELSLSRNQVPNRIVEQRSVSTKRLRDVLAEHIRPGQPIDFLSIDVEGFESEVLMSNDWHRFRPRYVLAECLETTVQSVLETDTSRLLTDAGYVLLAKTVNTAFYRNQVL